MSVREGIPTLHGGICFRSRLEARWASFFRLLGWQAHYEPFDLDGFIPDFVLHGHSERILAEVKPVAGADDPLFIATVNKIENSGWRGEFLIVSYFLPRNDRGKLCVGWLFDHYAWAKAPFQFTDADIVAGFSHEVHSFRDRISDYYDGCGGGGDEDKIEACWAQAGNEVQWRGQR